MNNENLIPVDKRPKSEQREIRSKGGKASGIARRKKKQTAELIKMVLSMQPQSNQQTLNALATMGYDVEINGLPTLEALAIISVAKNAVNGDLAALKFMYDYGLTPDMRAQLERERIAASAKTAPAADERPVIIDERPAEQ